MHHWRRDVVELAALFTAVAVADGVADGVADLVGHGPDGPALLLVSASALLATAALNTWWARRHGHAPPAEATTARPRTVERRQAGTSAPAATAPTGATEASGLWRMRTTVKDEPGALATLCAALATQNVDILSLQTHPLAEGTVDEFLLRAPGRTEASEIVRAVAPAGGTDTWIERADAHDLVDAPTRILGLAARTVLDTAELPLALRQLLGRCTVRVLPGRPADDDGEGGGEGGGERGGLHQVPAEGVLEGTVLRLRAPDGGVISVERPYLPFTPAEFARARALVELDTRIGPRIPHGRDVLTLPDGDAITVRRVGTGDLPAARRMHERCSARTLGLRYHGPVGDADRYLTHLLSPRFGRTLAAQTASGRLVGLGHLLWDGDETEVALLVEDDWQRRGVGAELLGRLVTMAAEAGCASVYAVTRASNSGMVAAMRGLGLPLDYQIEEGTMVITARPDATPVPVRRPDGGRRAEYDGPGLLG